MSDLHQALLRLQQELASMPSHPGGPRPTTLRIRLGLVHAPGPDGGSWTLATSASPHSVEIEFPVPGTPDASEAPMPGTTPAADAPLKTWTSADAALVGLELDAAFGPPGFDAAARASVFRELAMEAGPESLPHVLGALANAAAPLDDPVQERARHGIARLLERGPSGAARGGTLLRQLFLHHPFERVLGVIEDRWRFG